MFLLKIILFLVTVAIIVFFGFKKEEDSYYSFGPSKRQLFAFIPFMLFFIITFCMAYVPANNVGIKWSAFGGTSSTTLREGISFKSPLDKVYKIETTVQERTMKGVKVQTKDSQFVESQVNVKFKVNPENAFKVYKGYGTLENLKTNIISNYSQKAIENVVTQYNVIDALGAKKNEIYSLATKKLKDMLASEGVELVQLTIKDMNAGDKIEKAIAEEAVAKKRVETAEQNRLKAKKDAETKLIQAEADAKANKLKEKTITKMIVQQQMIDKWNGELPKVSGNTGLFNLDSLLK